jgi:DNA-binding MarR family transcriptional regulator
LSKYSRDGLIGSFIDSVRSSQTATDMLDEAVADYLGINGTAYRCLDILDREGPMTIGRLAELARISPGATTTLLDRLEQKGLARRTRDTEDRRRVLVEVTPELRQMAQQLYGKPEETASALAVYTDEQLEFLISFLQSNIAYQHELLRRLDALKAHNAAETTPPLSRGAPEAD